MLSFLVVSLLAVVNAHAFDYSVANHTDAEITAEAKIKAAGQCGTVAPGTPEAVKVQRMSEGAVRFTLAHPGMIPDFVRVDHHCVGTYYPGTTFNDVTGSLSFGRPGMSTSQVKEIVANETAGLVRDYSAFKAEHARNMASIDDAIKVIGEANLDNADEIATVRQRVDDLETQFADDVLAMEALNHFVYGEKGSPSNPRPGSLAYRLTETERRLGLVETGLGELKTANKRHVEGRLTAFGGVGIESPKLTNSQTGEVIRPSSVLTGGLEAVTLGYPGHHDVLVGFGAFGAALSGPGVWGGPFATGGYSFESVDLRADVGYVWGSAAMQTVTKSLISDRGPYFAGRLDYRIGEVVVAGIGVRGTAGGDAEFVEVVGEDSRNEPAKRIVGFIEFGAIFK